MTVKVFSTPLKKRIAIVIGALLISIPVITSQVDTSSAEEKQGQYEILNWLTSIKNNLLIPSRANLKQLRPDGPRWQKAWGGGLSYRTPMDWNSGRTLFFFGSSHKDKFLDQSMADARTMEILLIYIQGYKRYYRMYTEFQQPLPPMMNSRALKELREWEHLVSKPIAEFIADPTSAAVSMLSNKPFNGIDASKYLIDKSPNRLDKINFKFTIKYYFALEEYFRVFVLSDERFVKKKHRNKLRYANVDWFGFGQEKRLAKYRLLDQD